MLLSDAGAGACTLVIALLLFAGRLEVWHIYAAVAASSVFQSLRWPALSASIPLLVPKEALGRANGLVQMGLALAQTLAPLLAGMLLDPLGLAGLVLLDVATFACAVLTLLIVRIPKPRPAAGDAPRGRLLQEAAYGWTYITSRPGFMALLVLFAASNFILGLLTVLITPMVLGFASPEVLGRVLSATGAGMLTGGLAMSLWGGPRRRMLGIFGPLALQGLALLAGGLQPSAPLIAAAAFLFLFGFPVLSACSQAIWQSKVARGVQGRVFAMRQMVALSSIALARLAAGPLADHVFEPLLAPGGPLAGSVGRVLGVGPGRGIALFFLVLGIAELLVLAAAWSYPRLRRLEDEVPDADEAPVQGETAAVL
jgi:predicted MFS family arabinose efflux permease